MWTAKAAFGQSSIIQLPLGASIATHLLVLQLCLAKGEIQCLWMDLQTVVPTESILVCAHHHDAGFLHGAAFMPQAPTFADQAYPEGCVGVRTNVHACVRLQGGEITPSLPLLLQPTHPSCLLGNGQG